jgi:glycogen debranching enzyme-like protein
MQVTAARRETVTISTPVNRTVVEFGRETCGSLEVAEQREWLVTNGIGGFASGTVPGLLTRRYHGLLIAALKPPLGRTLLVSKVEEIAGYDASAQANVHTGVVLVNREDFFLFTPMLHEVAASDPDLTAIVNPVGRMLRKVNFFAGDVESIDLPKKRVELSHGFDHHGHSLGV